jgi:hypothetical protein
MWSKTKNCIPCVDYNHHTIARARQIFEQNCLPELFVATWQRKNVLERRPVAGGWLINFKTYIVSMKGDIMPNNWLEDLMLLNRKVQI